MKQTSDANSNTILTNTTHITQLTWQAQNQMRQRPIENIEENYSSTEHQPAKAMDGDHQENNDQEDQGESNSQYEQCEKQENEVASQSPIGE